MKSNTCKIEKGTKDLEAIFRESERVAEYNGLSHKQSLQLRLLCEEIDGMLPNIIDDFDGSLWIEYSDGVCKINVSIEIPDLNTAKKDELIGVAKNKKNAAAVGIVGKIRDAIENFLFNDEIMDTLRMSSAPNSLFAGYSGCDYSHVWTLQQYKAAVNPEENADDWDELEKSVIAAVADDVIVGVKGKKADIIVVKKFA